MTFCLRGFSQILGIALHILFVVAVSIADENPTYHQEVICRKQNKSRILELNYDGPMACRLQFKRNNQSSSKSEILWHAHKETAFCEQKLKKHVSLYEQSGWSRGKENTEISVVIPPISLASSRDIVVTKILSEL